MAAKKKLKRKSALPKLPVLTEKTEPKDDNSLGLDGRQVVALQKLLELGAEPAYQDEAGKMIYSKDPQTRAYQLVYEGRFGGPNRGQGRQKRAAQEIATHVRSKTPQMKKAWSRALRADAGTRANLDAIRLGVEIERSERKLQIEEEEHEGNIGNTREEILATLFELVGDPGTAAAIEGTYIEDDDAIEDAEVIEGPESLFEAVAEDSPAVGDTGSDRSPTAAPENGRDGGVTGQDGRSRSKRDRSQSPNPFTQAALRRAADR